MTLREIHAYCNIRMDNNSMNNVRRFLKQLMPTQKVLFPQTLYTFYEIESQFLEFDGLYVHNHTGPDY